MRRDMCADVKMEEGYMRLSVDFNNDESREKISNAIAKIEKQLNLFPSVIKRTIEPNCGNYSIEFNDIAVPRDGGEFFEVLMKELEIDHCSI